MTPFDLQASPIDRIMAALRPGFTKRKNGKSVLYLPPATLREIEAWLDEARRLPSYGQLEQRLAAAETQVAQMESQVVTISLAASEDAPAACEEEQPRARSREDRDYVHGLLCALLSAGELHRITRDGAHRLIDDCLQVIHGTAEVPVPAAGDPRVKPEDDSGGVDVGAGEGSVGCGAGLLPWPTEGSRWRNYCGAVYRVIGSETDDLGRRLVVCEPEAGGEIEYWPLGEWYAVPKFHSEPRFVRLGEAAAPDREAADKESEAVAQVIPVSRPAKRPKKIKRKLVLPQDDHP